MPIKNPPHSTPLCAENEALKISASDIASKPALDMVSVQRPHKVSPCPRCQSLDTKFCYFNNYNVKQPRHFCRKCQRYWTAGGALRDVPVGAGRRKHKTPLNSAALKVHHAENDLVLPHLSPIPGTASGMCYASNTTVDFPTLSHMDGTSPHSFQSTTAISAHAHDCHSGLNACEGVQEDMLHDPATDSSDAQSDTQQKEEALSSFRHHGSFHGVQKGAVRVQHASTEALPGLHDEAVKRHVLAPSSLPLPSHTSLEEKMEVESSAMACHALDKKMDICAHPLVWPEQFSKATSESIALQGIYGYGSASLAWNHPLMWPWLLPYTTKNGPTCSSMGQAAVSAAWASAVTATAANILQTSPLWNPYGWGRDVNKSEGLSLLGKRGCSSLHEQEPLCIPKTLKIGHPEEAMHSSILMTLGLSSLSKSSPASVTGFFNTDFQPKADVLQSKPTVQLLQQHREQQWSHTNPVAQAHSLAFQERS